MFRFVTDAFLDPLDISLITSLQILFLFSLQIGKIFIPDILKDLLNLR